MRRSVRVRMGLERLEGRETPAVVGTVDPSFGTAGTVLSNFGADDSANAIAVQSDGKYVVVGTQALPDGSAFLVARYNPNGTLDTTFGGGDGQTVVGFMSLDQGFAVAIQPDGKIVVAGTASNGGFTVPPPPPSADIAVARLNADGTLDTTFNGTGKQTIDFTTTDQGRGLVIRPNGSILVVGSTGGGSSDFAAAQLTSTGQLDASFDGDGKATYNFGGSEFANAVALRSDGRAVLVGSTTSGANPNNFAVLQIAPNGAPDTTFSGDGQATVDLGFNDQATSVALQPDGKIVVGGIAGGTSDDFGVARLNTDGSPDTTFSGDGNLFFTFGGTDQAHAVAVQPDGKIVLAGSTDINGGDFALLRLYPNGFLDTTFGTNGSRTVDLGSSAVGRALALMPNGRMVIAGSAVGTGQPDVAIARVIGTVEEGRNLTVSGPLNGNAVGYPPSGTGIYSLAPGFTVGFAGFAGNIRTAVADVNGDGVQDTILATGPGIAVRFAAISGTDNATVLIQPTSPFVGSESFSGGAFVSAMDIDQDGRAEIVVTPDEGGGPRVTIFSLLPIGLVQRANFLGIDDSAFRGGARTALGDANGDGTPDLTVQAGFLGGPRVSLYNGTTLFATPTRLVPDFFSFPGTDAATLRNGAYVAMGDVNGDGFSDLIFGGGPGGAPRVFILSGALVTAGNIQAAYGAPIASFFVAGNSTDRGGIRVAATDVDFDNRADVAVGTGQNVVSRVRVYFGSNFSGTGEPTNPQTLDPFSGAVLADGVYVG